MIDILPYKQKKLVKKIRFLRVLTSFVWMSNVLIFVSFALFLPIFITINSRFEIEGGQMKKLEESGAIVKAVDLASLESRTKLLSKKLSAQLPTSPVQYIAVVRDLTPDTISLKNFAMNSAVIPTLSVVGVAKTRQDLQKFIDSLRGDTRIALIDSPVSNFVKSKDSDFKITITFKK